MRRHSVSVGIQIYIASEALANLALKLHKIYWLSSTKSRSRSVAAFDIRHSLVDIHLWTFTRASLIMSASYPDASIADVDDDIIFYGEKQPLVHYVSSSSDSDESDDSDDMNTTQLQG